MNDIDRLLQAELERYKINRYVLPVTNVTRNDLLKRGVVVFGCGPAGKYIITRLIQNGITPDWIIDKNPNLQKSGYKGLRICSPATLNEVNDRYVVLASTHIREMASECVAHNATSWVLPAAMNDFCPMVGEIGLLHFTDLSYRDVARGYSLLADEKSREIFLAFLRYHYTFENNFSTYCDPVLYFPEDLTHLIDYSHFVDVGAFDGDTCRDWINKFSPDNGKICCYNAFEPDKESFSLLSSYIDTLPEYFKTRIKFQRIAICSMDGFVNMSGTGDGFSFISENADDSELTPVRKIDSLFVNDNITIIKADIEGAEHQLLDGAIETIKRYRPTLALSVYHKVSDLWSIPLRIHNLGLGYDIYLRHHHNVFSDTVCYAVPCKK
jgi:FkbM family methyltransferase